MPEYSTKTGRKFFRISDEEFDQDLIFRIVPYFHNGEHRIIHTERVFVKGEEKDVPIIRHFVAYVEMGELKILMGGRQLYNFVTGRSSSEFSIESDRALHVHVSYGDIGGGRGLPKWECMSNRGASNILYHPTPEEVFEGTSPGIEHWKKILSDTEHNPTVFGEAWAYGQRGISVANTLGIL